jgi:hypothetical protein
MSLTSLTTTVAPVLSEATTHDSGINPWLVGGATFALLVAMLVGLLMFGAGRDHS